MDWLSVFPMPVGGPDKTVHQEIDEALRLSARPREATAEGTARLNEIRDALRRGELR